MLHLGGQPTARGVDTSLVSNIVFTVHKIPPGYSMKVFDYNKSNIYENARRRLSKAARQSNFEGPFDPHALRISFAKGWGNNQGYSRADITCCPCWIEVHLVVPPLRAADKIEHGQAVPRNNHQNFDFQDK